MALVLLGQVAFCRPLYGGPAAPPPPSGVRGGGAAVSLLSRTHNEFLCSAAGSSRRLSRLRGVSYLQ